MSGILNIVITRDENIYDVYRKKVSFLFILLFYALALLTS